MISAGHGRSRADRTRPIGGLIARQVVISELRGEGESQSVRVVIEISGPPGDFSDLGDRTRRDIAAGLAGEVTRDAANSFGVILTELERSEAAEDRSLQP